MILRGKPQELADRMATMPSLEPLVTPHDIANAVAFFVSADGRWVNDQTLRIDGDLV